MISRSGSHVEYYYDGVGSGEFTSSGELILDEVPTKVNGDDITEYFVHVEYWADCGSAFCNPNIPSTAGGSRLYWDYALNVNPADLTPNSVYEADMGQPSYEDC